MHIFSLDYTELRAHLSTPIWSCHQLHQGLHLDPSKATFLEMIEPDKQKQDCYNLEVKL